MTLEDFRCLLGRKLHPHMFAYIVVHLTLDGVNGK
jgi:hypothetical protein